MTNHSKLETVVLISILIAVILIAISLSSSGCGYCTRQACCNQCGYSDKCEQTKEALMARNTDYIQLLKEKDEVQLKIADKDIKIGKQDLELKRKKQEINNIKRVNKYLSNEIIEAKNDLAICRDELSELQQPIIYIVQKGDWLSSLANRFYFNYKKWGLISNKNKIKNPNLIYPNQKLLIPQIYTEEEEKQALEMHNKMF